MTSSSTHHFFPVPPFFLTISLPCIWVPTAGRAQVKATTTLLRMANTSPTTASFTDILNKYFQLEELEDKETCTTEVFLNADRTVTVGKTDGPVFKEASGTWEFNSMLDGGRNFKMTLRRTYDAGKESSKRTDMGEFDFTVTRTFTGQISYVGSKVGVEGVIHDAGILQDVGGDGDREVGYFEMIDVTKERLGEEE